MTRGEKKPAAVARALIDRDDLDRRRNAPELGQRQLERRLDPARRRAGGMSPDRSTAAGRQWYRTKNASFGVIRPSLKTSNGVSSCGGRRSARSAAASAGTRRAAARRCRTATLSRRAPAPARQDRDCRSALLQARLPGGGKCGGCAWQNGASRLMALSYTPSSSTRDDSNEPPQDWQRGADWHATKGSAITFGACGALPVAGMARMLLLFVVIAGLAAAGCSARHPGGSATIVSVTSRVTGTAQPTATRPDPETRRRSGDSDAARRDATASIPATINPTGTTGHSTSPAGNPESVVAGTAGRTDAESDDAAALAEVPTDSPSASRPPARSTSVDTDDDRPQTRPSVVKPVSIVLLTAAVFVLIRRIW